MGQMMSSREERRGIPGLHDWYLFSEGTGLPLHRPTLTAQRALADDLKPKDGDGVQLSALTVASNAWKNNWLGSVSFVTQRTVAFGCVE